MEIFKEFTFEAAHRLPNLPPEHKCSRLHGHSYRVRVCVEGPLDEHLAWVVDFADIKAAFKPILEQLDHYWYYHHEIIDNLTGEVRPLDRESVDWPGQILAADLVVLEMNMVTFRVEHVRRFLDDGLAWIAREDGQRAGSAPDHASAW